MDCGNAAVYSGKEVSSGEFDLYRLWRRSDGCEDVQQMRID